MRIPAVSIHRDDRRIISHQILAMECLYKPFLDLELGSSAIAHTLSNFFECCCCNAIDQIAGGVVSLHLFVCQGSFELSDEVAGTDHVLAEAPDHFQCATVHKRNCKDQIVGRILHRDVAVICEHALNVLE